MGYKRFKDQILQQILEACSGEGVSKTQVVYKSGLNFQTVIPYMELLRRNGLAVRIEGEIPRYRTTEKGAEALGHMRALEELIQYRWVV